MDFVWHVIGRGPALGREQYLQSRPFGLHIVVIVNSTKVADKLQGRLLPMATGSEIPDPSNS